jgi:hypothetical protein
MFDPEPDLELGVLLNALPEADPEREAVAVEETL